MKVETKRTIEVNTEEFELLMLILGKQTPKQLAEYGLSFEQRELHSSIYQTLSESVSCE